MTISVKLARLLHHVRRHYRGTSVLFIGSSTYLLPILLRLLGFVFFELTCVRTRAARAGAVCICAFQKASEVR
jgi:hypothetical protein